MKCKNCGSPISSKDKFCGVCGTKNERFNESGINLKRISIICAAIVIIFGLGFFVSNLAKRNNSSNEVLSVKENLADEEWLHSTLGEVVNKEDDKTLIYSYTGSLIEEYPYINEMKSNLKNKLPLSTDYYLDTEKIEIEDDECKKIFLSYENQNNNDHVSSFVNCEINNVTSEQSAWIRVNINENNLQDVLYQINNSEVIEVLTILNNCDLELFRKDFSTAYEQNFKNILFLFESSNHRFLVENDLYNSSVVVFYESDLLNNYRDIFMYGLPKVHIEWSKNITDEMPNIGNNLIGSAQIINYSGTIEEGTMDLYFLNFNKVYNLCVQNINFDDGAKATASIFCNGKTFDYKYNDKSSTYYSEEFGGWVWGICDIIPHRDSAVEIEDFYTYHLY